MRKCETPLLDGRKLITYVFPDEIWKGKKKKKIKEGEVMMHHEQLIKNEGGSSKKMTQRNVG